jgi:hypothetical protein
MTELIFWGKKHVTADTRLERWESRSSLKRATSRASERVRDAVRWHFDQGRQPKVVRLHFVREEVKFREKVSGDETR